MCKNFQDATKNVSFDGDVHACVVLIEHVENLRIAGNKLTVFHFGNFQQRRFFEQVNDRSFVAVDSCLGDSFARQERRNECKIFSAVVFEVFANVIHVDGDLRAHELIDALQNVRELIFAGVGVVVTELARESAVDD